MELRSARRELCLPAVHKVERLRAFRVLWDQGAVRCSKNPGAVGPFL